MDVAQRHHSISNLLIIIALAVGLGLRLFQLDQQSLWNDEGTSVALAGRSLAEIARAAAADIHPPLYYFVLHGWVGLLGNSVFSVRLLSVCISFLTILTTAMLARRMFGPVAAVCTAWLTAIAPFSIYYAQETRMYALVTLCGTVAAWGLYGLLTLELNDFKNRSTGPIWGIPGSGLLYLVGALGALYTQYYAASLLLAFNLVFLLMVRWLPAAVRWRRIVGWVILNGAVALAFLPWFWMVRQQIFGWPAVSEALGLRDFLLQVARIFSLGYAYAEVPAWGLFCCAALSLLGLLPVRWSQAPAALPARHWAAYILTVCYLVVPIGLMFLLSLRRPLFNPKFLLLATPAYAILLGRGLSLVWPAGAWCAAPRRRLATLVLFILLLGGQLAAPLPALQAQYFDPRYARDNYKGIAETIRARATAEDAILIDAPAQIETFGYYYSGPLPVYPLPAERPPQPDKTRQALESLAQHHKRLFAIYWATDESDPANLIEGWLDSHVFKASDTWYGNVRLVEYAMPPVQRSPEPQQPTTAEFEGGIHLVGYSLLASAGQGLGPGDIVPLTLYWQAPPQTRAERYKVFIHLLDGKGNIVGQRDAEPGGGGHPTNTWEAGSRFSDNYGIPIPPGVPPVPLQVVIGLYNSADGRRLKILQGRDFGEQRLWLTAITIQRPATPPLVESLGLRQPLQLRTGDLTLIGYLLDQPGRAAGATGPFDRNLPLFVTLYWRAERDGPELPGQSELAGQPELALELAGDRRRALLLDLQSYFDFYPGAQWRQGEIVRSQHTIPWLAELNPGRWEVWLTRADQTPARLGELTLP